MFKIVFFSLLFSVTQSDINNKIISSLQNGNVQELSNHFNSQLEITLPNSSGNYSKEQAKAVLENFFKSYKPNNATLNHQTNGAMSTVLTIDLNTSGGNFRTIITLSNISGQNYITEIKIK